MKLSQAIGLKKQHQAESHATITTVHHTLQKPGLLSGQSRTYTPKDDDGQRLPSEYSRIQYNTETLLAEVIADLSKYFDSNATVEYGNCTARADVKLLDGTVLLEQVPVTYLLFLEKQLVDLKTLIAKLPMLDLSETWHYDESRGCYVSQAVETGKTQKTPKVIVKAAATQYHPAQTELIYTDEPIGVWNTIKFSTALPVDRIRQLLERVSLLQSAVKLAREDANTTGVMQQEVGEKVLGWLFA